ncbi:MAG TPA: sigma-70 family RNA polymerase sigma factor [Rubrivivax sp.]|nr:sigma-70 family RNA polymerase sigma factor [Rubrivivax sp.]
MNAAMTRAPDADDGGALREDPGWPGGDAFAEDAALADGAEGAAFADAADAAEDADAAQPSADAGRLHDVSRARAAGGMAVAASDAQLAQWIEAIAGHDERALAALYDATFARVFGLVRRIVRSAALAEEVVEDAYFQVWRQAVRFDATRGKALSWLLSMARSRAIDALRREARLQCEPLGGEAAAELASPTAAVDELLELARHRTQLHQALLRLGAQPRQLVSLAFLRGLSHEEIAEHTRLPLGTVKSQIRRALRSLRQTLGAGAALALVP